MATNNAQPLPPAVASLNAPVEPPGVAPAKPATREAASGSNANTPGKAKKILTLVGSVLAESGAGFGVGALLAQGNKTGTSLLVAAASLIFAFDVALRYIPATSGRGVFTWALMGTLVLSALALIPYNIMSAKKTKGKAPVSAAAPTMAGAWIIGALLFTLLVARGGAAGHMQGALQGSIISIMYMALASIAGYNMQTKQVGTGTFAGALWGLLAMFDALGLSRT